MKHLIATKLVLPAALLAGIAHGNGLDASARTQTRYQVSNLTTAGGSFSAGNSINNLGWVAGPSYLPGDVAVHANVWRNGTRTDLGTLGGANSNVVWPVKNIRGRITGIAQTAEPDPLNERWSCRAFFPGPSRSGNRCLGFVWEAGTMTALPTLGGNNGFAAGSNNLGQVVGWAENTVRDPTCVAPQVLQFRPVIWDPKRNRIKQLLPVTGDTVGAATAINDRGQVVGISGICDQAVGRSSAIRAVLWERDAVIDLGNIGGDAWNTPMAINLRGDVVGFANTAPGIGFTARAFLWTRRDGMADLGTLPGDTTSQALGINEFRQIVGTSCDADFNCRAFLWDNGVMTDLNALVAPGYTDPLFVAGDINDFGRITGEAFDVAAGRSVPFVATPLRRFGGNAGKSSAPVSKATLPDEVRTALMQRTGVSREDIAR